MSWTNEFDEDDRPLEPFELTVEQAAFHLCEGLWDPDQATQQQIEDALKKAVACGELPAKHGAPLKVAWRVRPIILDALAVATWAERAGLELESNGHWNDYTCSIQ